MEIKQCPNCGNDTFNATVKVDGMGVVNDDGVFVFEPDEDGLAEVECTSCGTIQKDITLWDWARGHEYMGTTS